MQKYILYRITSRSNNKPRIKGFNKFKCLDNLIKIFKDYKIIALADNCDESQFKLLQQKKFHRLIKTSLGNSKSFRYLIKNIIPKLSPDDIVYFVEDDYLHKSDAPKKIEEGLMIFDYVTLYDHPDKYGDCEFKNPFVAPGPLSEWTKIYEGKHCRWRTTFSTTMTFASHVKTIKQDHFFWDILNSRVKIPRDFRIWSLLTRPIPLMSYTHKSVLLMQFFTYLLMVIGRPKRYLGVPLDGSAAHIDPLGMPRRFEEKWLKP